MLALAVLLMQPPSEAPDTVLAIQMPRIEGHERAAASMEAYAEAAGVDLAVGFYDPASFDITSLRLLSEQRIAGGEANHVLWIVSEPPPLRVYLYEGETKAVWTRTLDAAALDALAAETLANVSVSVGLALQLGEVRDLQPLDPRELELEPESSRPSGPRSEPTPESPGPEFLDWTSRNAAPIWLRLSYLGGTFSEHMPWQSAVALRLSWKVRPRLAVWARYAYVATQAVRLDGVGFDLRRHPVTLGAGARLPLAPRIDVAAGGAVCIDPVTRVLDTPSDSVMERDAGLRLYGSASAYGGVGVHAAPRVRLALDVALEVLLTRADVVVRTGTSTARHEADRMRVQVAAGLEIGLGPAGEKN